MKNKEWLNELMFEHDQQATKENADKVTKELEAMLEAAIIKKKQEAQSDWDRIQAAKQFNQVNKDTVPIQTARTFDYKKYLETDAKAKELMSRYLSNKGYTVNLKEEDYGIDIEATKNENTVLFELEISSIDFDKENFKYNEVHFLARKKKMLDKQGDYNYVIISSNHQYALTAKASDIFKEDNYITKYAGKGRDGVDEFYKLPIDKVKFFKISLDIQ
jgi:hypothetical protein